MFSVSSQGRSVLLSVPGRSSDPCLHGRLSSTGTLWSRDGAGASHEDDPGNTYLGAHGS